MSDSNREEAKTIILELDVRQLPNAQTSTQPEPLVPLEPTMEQCARILRSLLSILLRRTNVLIVRANYERVVLSGKTPSESAQTENYAANQSSPTAAILDGRYTDDLTAVSPSIRYVHCTS